MRPWIYRQSPSVPALTNERVNVAIEDQSGRVWFLSFVGGPGVGTVKMLDGVGVGSVVQPGQEIAQFLMGSTCCMVSPVAPVQKVGATVVMGTSLLARPGFPISGNNTDGDSRF
ncbi:hypothetical protein EBZ80_23910 [bacterium]|nr:hypothetical protein [bacterium]